MSDIDRIHQRVTMISEVFTPTRIVNKGIREFLDDDYLEEHPMEEDTRFELRSTGVRYVDTLEYHQHRYDIAIGLAEKALSDCGTTPLLLSGANGIQEGTNGAARLFIGVRDPGRLRAVLDSLNPVGPEVQRSTSDRLYVEFAQGSLTRNVQQRRDAGEKLASLGRHPAAKGQLAVAMPPRLVTRDIHLHTSAGRVIGQSNAS
jgi:hypothetical protein